jgi:hypothetical protein
MFANGRTAIEGLSGRVRVAFDESTIFFKLESAGSRSSRTAPPKRIPLASQRLDQTLLLAAVRDGVAGRIDAGGQRRF